MSALALGQRSRMAAAVDRTLGLAEAGEQVIDGSHALNVGFVLLFQWRDFVLTPLQRVSKFGFKR